VSEKAGKGRAEKGLAMAKETETGKAAAHAKEKTAASAGHAKSKPEGNAEKAGPAAGQAKAAIHANAEKKAEQAEVNIGMVGHVDHGKTSLTQALTGKWTDTHSEELKRGISIRLGYADVTMYKCSHCTGPEAYTTKPVCPICGKKAEKLRMVSFVDAPGHETLMTTMLSGAALMNGAVLVIAANEPCPQPQTEEHLMALKMAGIGHIVVAQNKIDLVEPEKARENKKQISGFLEKNGYKGMPIVPIVANFSGNIDLLIEAIHENIPTPKFDEEKPLLMYCARSFDINKPGIDIKKMKGGVVGGTIIQGKAVVGKKILIRPGIDEKEICTDIRSLSCSSGELGIAVPGGLIAIGTGLDPSLTQNDRLRGQVIGTVESMPKATKEVYAAINYIKRVVENVDGKISPNEPVVLTIGTMAAVGNVAGTQGGRAKITLKNSVVVLPGQKIAISKKALGRWQLVAYAVAE
jgi:translation initiation factor 2 subunit 3